jgi:hypothetical protein
MSHDATRAEPPADGVILGYGPMLPTVAAAIGAWLMPPPWPAWAVHLGVIWAALILVFIAGVRRGFGFGFPPASTAIAIASSITYFVLGGLALVVGPPAIALIPLMVGYALAALLDRHAARTGNAPAYFARLRPRQMLLGLAGLAGLWAWTVLH